MKFVNVRELKANASKYLRIASSGENVVILSHGKPRAALLPLLEDDLEDFILAHNSKYQKMIQRAEKDYLKHGGIPIEKLIAETEDELNR
ncbi:MAG: type II toxin-antitoxin system prevent-host-death family antitoxin [bacterium]|nr:type II toxin-antitoxin system prevent-host-death family antitoxin [bacterium]